MRRSIPIIFSRLTQFGGFFSALLELRCHAQGASSKDALGPMTLCNTMANGVLLLSYLR
jgi:hypothetical protein